MEEVDQEEEVEEEGQEEEVEEEGQESQEGGRGGNDEWQTMQTVVAVTMPEGESVF